MNTRLIIALLAVFPVPALCQKAPTPKDYGRLTVRVTDESGAAVPHAQLGFRPQIETAAKDAETGADGTLPILAPAGDYTLFVTYPWFTPTARTIHVSQRKAEEVSVVLKNPHDSVIIHTGNQSSIDLNSAPTPRPTIPVSIKVTSQTGADVPFAQVWVGSESCALSGTSCGLHNTDERGRLRLKLAPGFYEVSVTRPFFARWRKQEIRVETKPVKIRVALTETPVGVDEL